MLKIFNTLTGKKEVFKPIFYKKINMYVCGVTVYDLCHIGHGRTFICFDIIVRYLRYIGYEVQYIRNITDIDDKIIALSNKNKESITDFTHRMISYMHNDFLKLNLLPPNKEPRATEYISYMIDMISKLLSLKHAYISKNGDVMFSIMSDINYGILSKQFIEKLKITNRIKNNPLKKNHIFDFVLWKIAKKNEPYWVSPWGNGRPGWHIECSAMSKVILGNSFDIHGGGSDLLFPHHENEIAQSTCVNRMRYANYWLHTGIVIIKNKKMSKSLGNIYTLQDVLKNYHAEVIRYLLISTHYRHPLYFSEDSLNNAEISLSILYRALRDTNFKKIINKNSSIEIDFINAMNNDFNTPKVLSIFLKIAHKINVYKVKKNNQEADNLASKLYFFGKILGLFLSHPEDFFKNNNQYTDKDIIYIQNLIEKRKNARKLKNWIQADKIRSYLLKLGIIIEDHACHNSIWYRIKK